MQQLRGVPGVRLIGTADDKASVMSFVLAGYSTEEVWQVLNDKGIVVHTAHHCVQPILRRFGVETTGVPRWPSTAPSTRLIGWQRWCAGSRDDGAQPERRGSQTAGRRRCTDVHGEW